MLGKSKAQWNDPMGFFCHGLGDTTWEYRSYKDQKCSGGKKLEQFGQPEPKGDGRNAEHDARKGVKGKMQQLPGT